LPCRLGGGRRDGGPAAQSHAVSALKELGIDISQQRSRMLTPELVDEADYIFGMTHSHVDSVNLLFPQAAEKTFLLREFDETLDEFEKDISDPIGGSYETYAYCRDQIEQGIFPCSISSSKPTKVRRRPGRRPSAASPWQRSRRVPLEGGAQGLFAGNGPFRG
jgi:protein-tyrosine-phosphatase